VPLDKNILKKKVFGIPVPIVALGAGVVGVIAFKKFGGGGAASSTADGAATPADYSGGSAGSGGSASDYSGGTGDYGSSADMGLGSGGGGTYDVGGGAFLPAAPGGGLGLQPIINKTVKIFRPVKRGRKISIINKVVVNPKAISKNQRPPNVVHNDKKILSPKTGFGSKPKPPTQTRPKVSGKQTPPILKRKTPARR
jgi:hypothetical protein